MVTIMMVFPTPASRAVTQLTPPPLPLAEREQTTAAAVAPGTEEEEEGERTTTPSAVEVVAPERVWMKCRAR
jgi:hypothetical protein